jgi:hypothetical protein
LHFSLLHATQLPRRDLSQQNDSDPFAKTESDEVAYLPVLTPFLHRTCRHPGLEGFGEDKSVIPIICQKLDGPIHPNHRCYSFCVICSFIRMQAVRGLRRCTFDCLAFRMRLLAQSTPWNQYLTIRRMSRQNQSNRHCETSAFPSRQDALATRI